MKRRAFDLIVTNVGAVLAVFLLIAGGLLMFGANFANSQVHNQLAEQQISFPPAAAFSHPAVGTEITPSMIPSVSQYAGQQLLTGEQAKVYADNFIAVHLNEIGGGKSYAQLSALAMAQPNNAALQGQVATVFKGTTLRGLLLEAYAFSVFGSIAMIAGIVALALGVAMMLLVVAGWLHYRKVPETQQFPARTAVRMPDLGVAPA